MYVLTTIAAGYSSTAAAIAPDVSLDPQQCGLLGPHHFRPTVLARGLLQRGDQFRCGREEAVLLRLGAADLNQREVGKAGLEERPRRLGHRVHEIAAGNRAGYVLGPDETSGAGEARRARQFRVDLPAAAEPAELLVRPTDALVPVRAPADRHLGRRVAHGNYCRPVESLPFLKLPSIWMVRRWPGDDVRMARGESE